MIGKRTYKVVLADDHNLVRRGLASLLASDGRYEVVAEAATGEDALEALAAQEADLLILDLCMPRLNGLETIRRLGRSRVKVLVLSMFDDDQFVAQALQLGAKGYLLKHAMDDELFLAIESVLKGEEYISSTLDPGRVREHLVAHLELTAREREVLQLIVDGLTTQEVAEVLAISPHTATRHRANLMQKLDAHNQVELVRHATQKGLIIMPRSLGSAL